MAARRAELYARPRGVVKDCTDGKNRSTIMPEPDGDDNRIIGHQASGVIRRASAVRFRATGDSTRFDRATRVFLVGATPRQSPRRSSRSHRRRRDFSPPARPVHRAALSVNQGDAAVYCLAAHAVPESIASHNSPRRRPRTGHPTSPRLRRAGGSTEALKNKGQVEEIAFSGLAAECRSSSAQRPAPWTTPAAPEASRDR
jgi:hypothetical protein